MDNRVLIDKAATPYKVVAFDLDGTLLNSLEDLADSANASLTACGFPEHPVSSYRQFVGDGVRMLLQRALPEESRTEETISRCLEVFNTEYRQGWNRKSVPYPGIPELLDWLQDQGYALALLTNKPHAFTQEIMKFYFNRWSFDPIYGASADFPRKPDPAGLVLIREKLGMESGEVIFMGDSNVDMRTANSAGALAAGALWGFRGAEELEQAGADLLLEDPLGLASWLLTPKQERQTAVPQRYGKEGRITVA